MRVLVTGATGNIGTSAVEALAQDPSVSEIVGLARRRPAWQPAKTRFVAADVTADPLEPHCRGADAVVHLSWAFQPTHDPIRTWTTNVEGGIRVFDAARAAGVGAVIYASSVGAYSPGPGRQVDETWPTHSRPTAAYGREKAYLERYLDAYQAGNPDIRVVRLRPCFVFKRESASEQRRIFAGPLVPRAILRPGRLPALPVPAGLRFQAVHSADVGEAFRLATVGEARGAFNIAADPIIDRAVLADIMGARPVTVPAALVRLVLAATWRARLVRADPALFQLLLALPTLDTTRAREVLGWRPRRSGIDAIREMLDGLADGAGMATPVMAPDRSARR